MIPLSENPLVMITQLMRELAGERCRQYSINLPLWLRIQLFLLLTIPFADTMYAKRLRKEAPQLFYLLYHTDGR